MHLKDFFFFDMNPIAFLCAIGLKNKKNSCAFKEHKDHIFVLQYLLILCILKKSFQKKKFPTYLPKFFSGCNLNHTYYFIWPHSFPPRSSPVHYHGLAIGLHSSVLVVAV